VTTTLCGLRMTVADVCPIATKRQDANANRVKNGLTNELFIERLP
jgi:hypothetical protein